MNRIATLLMEPATKYFVSEIKFPEYNGQILERLDFTFSDDINLLPDLCKRYYHILRKCNIQNDTNCVISIDEGPVYYKESDHNCSFECQNRNPKYFTYADIHDTFVASSLTLNYLIGDKCCETRDAYDLTYILQQNKYFEEKKSNFDEKNRELYILENKDFQNLYKSSDNLNSTIKPIMTNSNTLYKIPRYTPYKLTRTSDTVICQRFSLVCRKKC
jgi:hypothetical protein